VRAGAVADWLSWRPEWPVAALAAAAWGMLASQAAHAPTVVATGTGHLHHLPATGSPAMSLTAWTVMSAAMMLPLSLPAARHVGLNSPHHHRFVGVVLFTTAFLVPWVVLGAVLLPLGDVALSGGATGAGLGAVLLAAAAGWQLSPWKRQAVLSCSRSVPLAPFGLRAVSSRVEFGGRQSLRCMAACWPLMALMVVLPHSPGGLLAMGLVTVALVAEMRARRRRLLIPWLAVPMAVAALATGVLA
jgi:predicted metal-binding membrane protein